MVWDADAVCDDVGEHVDERIGPGGVCDLDDIEFIKRGSTAAGSADSTEASWGRPTTPRDQPTHHDQRM